MGSWAVQPKITNAVRTPITTFLKRSSLSFHQICPTTITHFYDSHHKRQHAFLRIEPFPFVETSDNVFLHTSAHRSFAFHPFDKMSQREQSSENGRFFDVLDLVKFAAMKPDIVTATVVHSFVRKVGILAHLPASTSLLMMYSRAGDFDGSVTLFSEILYKDVVVWNAMMTVCIENSYFGAAVDFFLEMIKGGSGFDSGTLVIAISALSHAKILKQGRVLHGLSVKAGMISDTLLCNAFVYMYAKCSDMSTSESLFEGMHCRDLVSWNSVMTGCLYNNNPEKSLHYLKKMTSCGKQADGVSLSCAIAACTRLQELDIGRGIHGRGIKLGYDESSYISVANSLISLYSRCGEIEAADTVFRGIFRKDVISWNSMIDGFASNGMILETFNLLLEMQFKGSFQPDTITVVTVIGLCAELTLLREGRSVHGFIVRRSMGLDLSVVNSLMDLYMKCNNVKAAEQLFNTMAFKDLVSWNTVISGYSQNEHSREAQILFKELLLLPSYCSLSTVLAILPSCHSHSSLQFGKSIHCWQLKLGFSGNNLAINSLMSMYVNCGDLKSSFLLFSAISATADTACWNTIISGCMQNGHFWKALQVFNFMRKESHVSHDSITTFNVLSACGNLGLVLEGKLLHGLSFKTLEGADIRIQNALITMYGRFGEIESAKLVFNFFSNRNLCSWNCMISALSHNKDGKAALECFSTLSFEPDEITISSVLSACTQLGLMRHGKQIHAYVFRFGFQRNSFISAALVDMYSNCGRLDMAIEIFQNFPEKSIAAWNSMISAFGFHNNGQKAIQVFHEMIKSGTSPTKSTFINLLSTCSHLGLVDEGKWYYSHMSDDFGVEPETEHHVCVVDMLGRSGRLNEAYEFIERMETKPEPGVWGALLSACNYHGDLEMGREVAEILFTLEPENAGYYVSMFNMYVSAGRWSDAAELRRVIQEKGLKKPLGYSLIDVGIG